MTGEQHASVQKTLKHVSDELAALALSTDILQHVIGEILNTTTQAKGDAVFSLQDLDRIKQTLSGLADFMAEVSHATPTEYSVDISQASQCLTLRDLAARLNEGPPDDKPRKAETISFIDDYELF